MCAASRCTVRSNEAGKGFGGYEFGIRAHYDGVDEATWRSDAWGAIAAWAWSLSRVQDYFEADGHMLLALIASRAVLLQTGKYDHAADPKGEFLAAVAAGPVYELLGKQDLGTAIWPPSEPILNDLGYYMHDRGHGMALGDWEIYRTFLRKHLLR